MIDRSKLFGSELLVAVLANFPEEKFQMHDTSDFIRALHRVKSENVADEFFANYVFDEDGRYPDSRVLSEALDTLQHTTMLRRENPYLINYSVSGALKRYFSERVRPKIQDEQKIKMLAVRVYELVRTSYTPTAPQYAGETR